MSFFQTFAVQSAVSENFADADTLNFLIVAIENFNGIINVQGSRLNLSGQQAADELVRFQRGGQH